MVYQALYRKWRPRTFDSVVGQKTITDTLKNALIRGTVSHAFLFAGPRGTGKTSCAKILAKALNCTNLQNGEPCNECPNCRAADKGSMPDIIEIDAASNNGVDEIRNIRDKAKYAPTQGKCKVYIIDEVHMLSMGAFNALLKTLEEPPAHVVFILATTELQKVPATIISRTQRYNFKRISVTDLVKRMEYILGQEKVAYDERALRVIAQVADGGMRDALSILDQLLSYEKDKVNYQDAIQLTGYADEEKIEDLFLSLIKKDVSSALTKSQALLSSGASVQNILTELINIATRVLLDAKTNKDDSNFFVPDLVEQACKIPTQQFFGFIDMANAALTDLRYTNQQQIPLKVFVVKAAAKAAVQRDANANNGWTVKLDKLTGTVRRLQKQVKQIMQAQTTSSRVFTLDSSVKQSGREHAEVNAKGATKKSKSKKQGNVKDNRKNVYHVLENATRADLTAIKNIWPDLNSELEVSERALLDVLKPVAASPDQVVMKCKYALWFEKASADSDLLTKLTGKIAKFTHHDYQIVLVPDKDWLDVRSDFVKSHKDELLAKKREIVQDQDEAENHDKERKRQEKIVNKAKSLFGDAVNIKD